MGSAVDPFLNEELARRYEGWYDGPGRRADRLEKRLLARLLGGFGASRSVLEVGCGTGHFSRWLVELGYEVTGLDLSPAMLRAAGEGGGVHYIEGDARAIPMAARAIDLVILITTLEFVGDPAAALREAVRVARHGLVLGVLNRASLLARRRRRAGGPVWSSARFYTPAELAGQVRAAAGDRLSSLRWRTTLWPRPLIGSLPLPWGGFIGMAVHLDGQTRSDPT